MMKIRIAVSRDRGLMFSKAVTITAPSQTGPSTRTFLLRSVHAAGTLYIAFAVSAPGQGVNGDVISHSNDHGLRNPSAFVPAATAGTLLLLSPNTTFRDGITENFAASPTWPGH